MLREETFAAGTEERGAGDMVMVTAALSEALTSASICHGFAEDPYKEPSGCGTEPSLEEITGERKKKPVLLSWIR